MTKAEEAVSLDREASELADAKGSRRIRLGIILKRFTDDDELPRLAGFPNVTQWAEARLGKAKKLAEQQMKIVRALLDARSGCEEADLEAIGHNNAYQLARVIERVPSADRATWIQYAKEQKGDDFKAACQAILDDKPDHIEKMFRFVRVWPESMKVLVEAFEEICQRDSGAKDSVGKWEWGLSTFIAQNAKIFSETDEKVALDK